MKFVRKRKRGQNKKVRKTWFSEEGYRIVWRKEVCGVRVPARFQACVRTVIPYSDGQPRQMWEFVNYKRRLIKTLQAAQDECEKHKRLWTRACEATGIRALKELFGGKLPMGMPLWARKRRAAKRTRNSSKSTGRRERNTTNSPASDAKSSGGSRKKRSKPSGS